MVGQLINISLQRLDLVFIYVYQHLFDAHLLSEILNSTLVICDRTLHLSLIEVEIFDFLGQCLRLGQGFLHHLDRSLLTFMCSVVLGLKFTIQLMNVVQLLLELESQFDLIFMVLAVQSELFFQLDSECFFIGGLTSQIFDELGLLLDIVFESAFSL